MIPAKKTTDASEEKKPAKKPAAARKPAAAKKAVVHAEKPALKTKDAEALVAASQAAMAVAAPKLSAGGYIYALGRRKTAIAQTRLWPTGSGEIKVNGAAFEKYFTVYSQQEALKAPLKAVGQDDKVTVTVDVYGGGMRGQSEAARLGISRALILLNPTFRTSLKQLGYLTRDPREKERKKYGLKKARKGPQWAKR